MLNRKPHCEGSMVRFLLAALVLGVLISCSGSPIRPAETKIQTATNQPAASVPTDPDTVPPQTVRLEKVENIRGVKTLTVSNTEGRYLLSCDVDQPTCLTPTPGKDYWLFNKSTKVKFPGATEYVTLKWLQDWTISYTNEENIGLIPAEGAKGGPDLSFGIYRLRSWEKTPQQAASRMITR